MLFEFAYKVITNRIKVQNKINKTKENNKK